MFTATILKLSSSAISDIFGNFRQEIGKVPQFLQRKCCLARMIDSGRVSDSKSRMKTQQPECTGLATTRIRTETKQADMLHHHI